MDRWSSWSIPGLQGEDKTLCPVQSLRDYLDATSSITTGPLFRAQTSPRPLSRSNISANLQAIIKAGDKDSFPLGHDIRKLASSLAFFSGMKLKEISRFTGWKSSSVFLKHYCLSIENLRSSCVSVGTQVHGLMGNFE